MKTLAKRCGWVNNVERQGVYHNGIDDARTQIAEWVSIKGFLGIPDIKY